MSLPLTVVCRVAYIECGSFENANTLKTWFDNKYAICLVWCCDHEPSSSDFQNRRATATFTGSSQGNPFRTLPKGKKGVYMRDDLLAEASW